MVILFSFLVGLVCGSFLNVVAYRVPRGESVLWPRSYCTACGRTLTPWELIPIVSWLWLGARCRVCKAPISLRYPLLELTTALLFATTSMHFSTWGVRIGWDVFWMFLMTVMGTDFTSMRVPNVLSYPGFIFVFLLSGSLGVQSWYTAMLGAMTGFLLLFAVHLLSRGNMGMGDAKLYLSIGAMLGPLYSVESFVLASLSGAVLGILLRTLKLIARREYIPFVPHIAIGVILTVFFGHPLTLWYVHQMLGL